MATYKIQKGDTLSEIAADAGISLAALIKLNPQIKNPSLIKPGQVITTSKATPAKPATPKPAPAGGNDAQNAAKLEAEEKAKAYALSPAGMRAALDKINAEAAAKVVPVTVTPTVSSPAVATSTAKAIPVGSAPTARVDNFQESINAAAGMDSTPAPDGIEFASLTPEQRAAISGISEQGSGVTSNLVVEPAGNYTFDIKTGVLLFNGSPYTGTYNGFDYENGNKKEATVKEVVDFNNDPLDLKGPTDAELARMDAFEQLKGLFESYNLGSLAGKISEYMKAGKGPNETVLLLKKSDEYNLRFQGNTLRLAAGLNVMSEDAYLQLEDSYAETLTRYGLRNMLSTDRTKNEAMFAKYMGNDLAAPEFKNRIELVTDRVMNADPGTKETFKKFFPNITDADLVSYFLSPKDTLSKLQEKATAAEIGGVATSQGLTTSLTSATDLAKFGIDKTAAIEGYADIKEVLPTSQKLGNVYEEAGIKYDQASGEAEFFKQNQDAKVKRKRLESLERGSFSASAGNAPGAYSTAYLKKSSTAGQI